MVALPIDEASAKVRSGPPKDDEEDYTLDCWAGELPLVQQKEPLVADPRLREGTLPSSVVTGWRRPAGKRG